MAKYELPDNVVNNILVFLDRVETKGIKEASAILEIVALLNNPENKSSSEQSAS